VIAALVVFGTDPFVALFSSGQGPLEGIELKTYDWRLRQTADPTTARQDIALVEIDETSLRQLEGELGRWPWPRVVHSMLLDFLGRAPAKLIAYDVDFAEADSRLAFDFGRSTWSGRESDDALVSSVRKLGNVILPANASSNDAAHGEMPDELASGLRVTGPGIFERPQIRPPFSPLSGAARALGHSLFVLDADGPLRHSVPLVRMGDHVVPSFALTMAMLAQNIEPGSVRLEGDSLILGDRVQPLRWHRIRDRTGDISYQWSLIHFRGPALLADLDTPTYAHYSAVDLIRAEDALLKGQAPVLNPAVFKDKLVFVGVTGEGMFDVFQTPFAGGRMSGIQINAAVVDDLLSNRFLRTDGAVSRVSVLLGAAVAAGLLAVLVPAWWATLAVTVLMGILASVSTRLLANGYVMNLSQPMLAASLALFGGVGYQYFVEGREKRKMKRLFGQYVSKDVYEQLVANPELARLGGHYRAMTVLFSDIKGFTNITEAGDAEEIVHMLNEYFSRMVAIVFQNKGTLDKFVGDMVMALFGAPLDDPQHADHALESAMQMIEALGQLNREWRAQGRFSQLDIGIGINSGDMIAGNIGSEAIMSYTVIGDAVNLGARLESATRKFQTRIIISEATKERLTGRYHLRSLGSEIVKGKSKPVTIYEVLGRGESGTLPDPTAEPLPAKEAHL
jgi:adenylate cyclase